MRIVSGIFITLGVLALLLILFLLAGYLLFSLTPDIKSEIQTEQVSADAAKSFNTKVEEFKRSIEEAAATQQKKEVTLSITEEELNSSISVLLAEGKLPFKELLISLKDNLCWIYFALDSQGYNAKIGIVAKPEMVKTDIKIRVIRFQLGKLPLPKSVDNGVTDLLNILVKMQNPVNDLPAEMKSVKISDKQLYISVITKPAE